MHKKSSFGGGGGGREEGYQEVGVEKTEAEQSQMFLVSRPFLLVLYSLALIFDF